MPEPDISSIRRSIKRAERYLRSHDDVLAMLIARFGPCTMFDDHALWHKPPFHVLVWAIINQQLSVASARSIENRLLALHRGNCFRQATLSRLSDAQLAACGLSRQKIRYLRALCDTVAARRLPLHKLTHMDNHEIADILITLPGIGPWTIDMFLMFSLARLDILPLGDLALRKSICLHYGVDDASDINKLQDIVRNWQPYQSIASWYLWCAVD